jgi:hypothetical protein
MFYPNFFPEIVSAVKEGGGDKVKESNLANCFPF